MILMSYLSNKEHVLEVQCWTLRNNAFNFLLSSFMKRNLFFEAVFKNEWRSHATSWCTKVMTGAEISRCWHLFDSKATQCDLLAALWHCLPFPFHWPEHIFGPVIIQLSTTQQIFDSVWGKHHLDKWQNNGDSSCCVSVYVFLTGHRIFINRMCVFVKLSPFLA